MAKSKTKAAKRVEAKPVKTETVEVKPQAVESEWIEVEAERECVFCKKVSPPRYDNRGQARCTFCWERFPSEG